MDREFKKIAKGIYNELRAMRKELQKDKGTKLIYDQEDAVEFILKDLSIEKIGRVEINAVLNADERYMRSIGIIDD